MGFREREKSRVVPLKGELFSAEACEPGLYGQRRYDFCLRNDRASENLHASIRDQAIDYFRERNIPWHDAVNGVPSNHLCCSQSFCVNFWFPFRHSPGTLVSVLRDLGFDVAEILPFDLDRVGPRENPAYVAFEWIGKRNYLREGRGGKVSEDNARTRGHHFTSLDFAFRFRRSDGLNQIVAGEWKYTERYSNEKNIRFSDNGTDRLKVYKHSLEAAYCQIDLAGLSQESLFFDPFDQLMRQQLLCSSMEQFREMDADVVSLLHMAPAANHDLLRRVTSPALRGFGSDVHAVWKNLVKPENFMGVYIEDALPIVCRRGPNRQWAAYMRRRYGGMR